MLALTNFDTGNIHAANGFAPKGLKGVFSALATGGIIFSYLGFEQADQLAGEAANPKRDIPCAIIGSIVIGTSSTCCCRSPSCSRCRDSAIGETWVADRARGSTPLSRALRRAGDAAQPRLAGRDHQVDAVIAPAGTGLIYTTGSSRLAYGLSRNGYVPSVFEWINERGVPWVGLIAAFVTGCICFLPFPSWQSLVGLITSASVLMYAGAPLSLGAFRGACRTRTVRTGCRWRRFWRRRVHHLRA